MTYALGVVDVNPLILSLLLICGCRRRVWC
ncbi:GlyGly-CTERM sorting domain-containing protein, partial [Enterobacter hormaechei]